MKVNIEKKDNKDFTIAEVILIIAIQMIYFGFVGFILWLLFNI